MTDTLTKTDQINVTSDEYQVAIRLHNRILANGQIAAQAIVEFSLELKEMRDKNLYTALSFESFEDYVETAVGIKKRQAYNYIRAIERLGVESMTEHAHLGITKLHLIANIASEERKEFIEMHPVADMSTKQLEETVAELHKAREQISFLENEVSTLKNFSSEESNEEIKEVNALREEFNSMAKEFENLQAELDKRKEEEKEVFKVAKAVAEEKAQKKINEAVEKAKAEAIDQTTSAMKLSLSAVEKEKAEAIEKAAKLEKQLAISNNQSSLMIAFLFEQIDDAVQKIQKELQGLDDESHSKYAAAVSKFLTQQVQAMNN